MDYMDEAYFETKDALDVHLSGGAPVPEDLLDDCEFHGIAVPAGTKVAWDHDMDGDPAADVAYQDGNPFGIWKGGDE